MAGNVGGRSSALGLLELKHDPFEAGQAHALIAIQHFI